MPICAAFNCSYKPGRMKIPGRTYHRFPLSRPELLKKWILKVRRKNWTPNRYSILCSYHFEEHCFYRYGLKVYLHHDAVPTIFDYPIDAKDATRKTKQPLERICKDYPLQEVTIPNDPELDAKNVKKEHSYTLDEEKTWAKKKYQKMQRIKAKLRQDNSYQRGIEDPSITEQQTDIEDRMQHSIEQETATENPQIQMIDFSSWGNQIFQTCQILKAKLTQSNSYQREDSSITEQTSIEQETAIEDPEILESDFESNQIYKTCQMANVKLTQSNSYQREDSSITEQTSIKEETETDDSEIQENDFESLSNQIYQTCEILNAKLTQSNSYQREAGEDSSVIEEQFSIEQEIATEDPEIQESDFEDDSFVCQPTFYLPEQDNDSSNSDTCQTPSFRKKGQKRRWDVSPEDTSFIKELLEQQNHLISEQVSALNTIVDLNKRLIKAMTNSQL